MSGTDTARMHKNQLLINDNSRDTVVKGIEKSIPFLCLVGSGHLFPVNSTIYSLTDYMNNDVS